MNGTWVVAHTRDGASFDVDFASLESDAFKLARELAAGDSAAWEAALASGRPEARDARLAFEAGDVTRFTVVAPDDFTIGTVRPPKSESKSKRRT